MESFIRTRSHFHGSHSLRNHPDCGHDCGHLWTVQVVVAGEEDHGRWNMPVDERKLMAEMAGIARELSGKDIDKMVKPSLSSPMGLAHWFYERLASRYDVREVAVCQDDEEVWAILKGP